MLSFSLRLNLKGPPPAGGRRGRRVSLLVLLVSSSRYLELVPASLIVLVVVRIQLDRARGFNLKFKFNRDNYYYYSTTR